MLNITIETWLQSVHGDDLFFLNVRRNNEQIYFGYENAVPDEVKKMIIDMVYVDTPDNALGIHVL